MFAEQIQRESKRAKGGERKRARGRRKVGNYLKNRPGRASDGAGGAWIGLS
jgi:hypothetical protein